MHHLHAPFLQQRFSAGLSCRPSLVALLLLPLSTTHSATLSAPLRQVSLANGCVCCVLRNDLSDEIRTMAATGNFDAIVVECSGIAEPRQLEAMFKEKFPSPSSTPPDSTAIPIPGVGSSSLPDKRTSSYIQANTTATTAGRDPASNLPYLDNLVTVVDSENFLERIQSDKRVGENAAFIAAENASAQVLLRRCTAI